jgi:hypothetical protein
MVQDSGKVETLLSPFYLKVLSECPGFDSGDPNADIQDEIDSLIQEEEYDLEGRRPGNSLESHWE